MGDVTSFELSGGGKHKNLKKRERGKTHIDSETHMDLKDLWPALLQY